MADELSLFDPFATLAEIRGQGAQAGDQKHPQKLPQAPAEEIHSINQRLGGASATSAASADTLQAHGARACPRTKKMEKRSLFIRYLRGC